jgi:hypothetical protein
MELEVVAHRNGICSTIRSDFNGIAGLTSMVNPRRQNNCFHLPEHFQFVARKNPKDRAQPQEQASIAH